MSSKECITFETFLAYYTAPTLFGIKPASLFTIRDCEYNTEQNKYFNQKAYNKGFELKVLCKFNNRIIMILYNKKLLTDQLLEKNNAKLLKHYGYKSLSNINETLDCLAQHILQNKEFPHEIGIFLGYPFEDVCGFINNKGKNFKYSGYWKVYSDEKTAKKLFKNYTKCRDYLCNKLNSGNNLYKILNIST